jgi:hypothetical protein
MVVIFLAILCLDNSQVGDSLPDKRHLYCWNPAWGSMSMGAGGMVVTSHLGPLKVTIERKEWT